jgi:hypothetical protein
MEIDRKMERNSKLVQHFAYGGERRMSPQIKKSGMVWLLYPTGNWDHFYTPMVITTCHNWAATGMGLRFLHKV